jgi:actin-related protein
LETLRTEKKPTAKLEMRASARQSIERWIYEIQDDTNSMQGKEYNNDLEAAYVQASTDYELMRDMTSDVAQEEQDHEAADNLKSEIDYVFRAYHDMFMSIKLRDAQPQQRQGGKRTTRSRKHAQRQSKQKKNQTRRRYRK